ncbi:SAM-dependent methyltransferase [Aliarcobacter cryaerophilus]|uniref:SAM-dependent methyltransferase n=1 Tax=Aliarcobacter cryaerophilus TaxID=28198 RepID=UPI003BB07470
MLKNIKKIMIGSVIATNCLFGNGELSIVSTGTGDLDNMTLKAYNIIKEADIFFTMDGKAEKYASLIGDKPVYKAGHGIFANMDNTKMSKEELEKLKSEAKKVVLDGYKAGKKIVLIENGDPTIYGPQISFLKEFKDLNPKIIPGMSSFNAANAALQTAIIGGIKDMSGVTLTIGSDKNNLISTLAPSKSTIVFFMDREFDKFIEHLNSLYPKDIGIAIVIDAGSKDNEKVIIATLGTIKEKVKEKLPFNHLVYIGDFLK